MSGSSESLVPIVTVCVKKMTTAELIECERLIDAQKRENHRRDLQAALTTTCEELCNLDNYPMMMGFHDQLRSLKVVDGDIWRFDAGDFYVRFTKDRYVGVIMKDNGGRVIWLNNKGEPDSSEAGDLRKYPYRAIEFMYALHECGLNLAKNVKTHK